MADSQNQQQELKKPGQGQPQQPILTAPIVSGFRIHGKRIRQISEISRELAELSFLETSIEGDSLVALNVESRNIQKNPYLFSIIKFMEDRVDVMYTCLPNMSPKKRRIDVLRHFLNLLTLVEDCYKIETREIYQLLESSVADMTEYVTADYDRLFSVYDNLKSEFSTLQKKYKDAADASATLSKENYDLKSRNDELTLKLRGLETYSDQVLSLKIQEWLSEHKGEINISEFSKVYNVPETRIEQILNKLVTEGYIETKG